MKRIAIIGVILICQNSWSENKTIAVKNCKLKFETTGRPTLVRIEGKSEHECTGKLVHDGTKVVESEFVMPLDKIDTGIQLRNKHLRENYLHVDKFPNAKLKITNAENFKEQLDGGLKKSSKLEATIEIHGKEAPILDGSYEVQGKKATVKFAVDLPSHGVEQPSFMGVKIVDKVNATVTLEY